MKIPFSLPVSALIPEGSSIHTWCYSHLLFQLSRRPACLPNLQIHSSVSPAPNWQLSEELRLVFFINNPESFRLVIRGGRKKQWNSLTSLLWLLDAKTDVTNDMTSLLRASVWKLLSRADMGLSVLLPVMSLWIAHHTALISGGFHSLPPHNHRDWSRMIRRASMIELVAWGRPLCSPLLCFC